MMKFEEAKSVKINYVNWRGEQRWRQIQPTGKMMFESTIHHQEAQWLMEALDPEDNVIKWFAMGDIVAWLPYGGVILHGRLKNI